MMNTTHPPTGEDPWFPLQWLNLERGTTTLRIPAPLLRIHACGLLRVEVLCEMRENPILEGRYRSLPEEQARGRNGAQALTLLKLLISRPHRHAPKHYLMEHLGHEEQAISEGRLDDLVTKLRGLLCPQQWEQVRTSLVQHVHSSATTGNGYRLAVYPLIWLDTDALAWYVEQAARLERFGEPELACTLWERVSVLSSRGDYLDDEEYADWAVGKRGEVARGRRASIHALSRLLVATAGEAGEAQALHLLSAYCSQYPLDEDALRPLMELLGKHERFGEALAFYEQTCALLAEDGLAPNEKTRDVAQAQRAKQISRNHVPSKKPNLSLPYKMGLTDFPLGQSLPPGDIPTSSLPSPTQPFLQARGELLSGLGGLTLDTLRRQFLQQVLGLTGVISLSSADTWFSPVDPSLMALCEQVLALNWEQYYAGQTSQIETLPTYLTCLTAAAARRTPTEQSQLLSLLCRFYQLSGVVARDHLDFGQAGDYAGRAIGLAFQLENPELIAASLLRRAKTYLKQKRHQEALQDLEAALPYAKRVRAPLKGYISQATAEVSSMIAGNDAHLQTASLHLLDQAEDILREGNLEEDGSFVKFNETGFLMERARILTRFGMKEQAHRLLQQVRGTLGPELARWHTRLVLDEAHLFLLEGHLDACCQSLLALPLLHAQLSRSTTLRIEECYQQLVTLSPHLPLLPMLGECLRAQRGSLEKGIYETRN